MTRPLDTPTDVLAFPLEGARLIEASAGTGKTYTIANLYLRQVLTGAEVGILYDCMRTTLTTAIDNSVGHGTGTLKAEKKANLPYLIKTACSLQHRLTCIPTHKNTINILYSQNEIF
jgi:hypothetical protein